MNEGTVIYGAGAEVAADEEWRQRRTRGALTASEAARQNARLMEAGFAQAAKERQAGSPRPSSRRNSRRPSSTPTR